VNFCQSIRCRLTLFILALSRPSSVECPSTVNVTKESQEETIMKLHRLLLAIAAIGLINVCVADVRADGFAHRSGLPWFAYGNSGSLYGLGRLPVPPYYAIHPPVYYSLPQARSYGHSPFAHSGDYEAPATVTPRIVMNPHIERRVLPKPVGELPAPLVRPALNPITSTAKVIVNPYFSAETGAVSSLVSQSE
jgi:hypothetical protein